MRVVPKKIRLVPDDPATPGGRSAQFPGADLGPEAVAFGRAVEEFKRARRRPFPALSDLLGVLYRLGYRRVSGPDDGGPVDGPFLAAAGFAAFAPPAAPAGRAAYARGRLLVVPDGDAARWRASAVGGVGVVLLRHVRTRGELRRLCDGLGDPLPIPDGGAGDARPAR